MGSTRFCRRRDGCCGNCIGDSGGTKEGSNRYNGDIGSWFVVTKCNCDGNVEHRFYNAIVDVYI